MQVVQFNTDILRYPYGRHFEPNVSYIIEEAQLRYIKEYELLSGYSIVKQCDAVCDGWQYPKPIESLLVWNTGRIGDQLWTTAVVRKIKQLMPHVEIDVIVQGKEAEVWQHNKDIRSIRFEPVTDTLLNSYDGYLFYDETVAALRSEDQPNCYSVLFEKANLPFDASDCIPNFRTTRTDEFRAYNKIIDAKIGEQMNVGGHFIVGLHTAVDSRNLLSSQVTSIIRGLSNFSKDVRIFGLSTGATGASLQEQVRKMNIPQYVDCNDKLNISEIAAIMNRAACVIAPDSMLVHLAAAMGTATVALMSTCSPESRVATYPYCVPIWKREACPEAPCFWKQDKLFINFSETIECTPCYKANISLCRVAVAVTVTDVLKAVNEATKKKYAGDGFALKELRIA